MNNLPVSFDKDYTNRKVIISYRFNAPLNTIWDAFTHPEILEKWFAPKPYRAITKVMEFQDGGRWLYYMLSPEDEKIWGISVFRNIKVNKSFEASDAFSDENGVINTSLPQMTWHYDFSEDNGKTHVVAIITLPNEESMKQLFTMGFEEGYKTALNQLQKLLEK